MNVTVRYINDYAAGSHTFRTGELFNNLSDKIGITKKALSWYLNMLAKEQKIYRVGRGVYSTQSKQKFLPHPNKKTISIGKALQSQFPLLHFCTYNGEILAPLQHHLSAEYMLEDKLTAFAPNTSGIPYVKGNHDRSLEIIKQLYDVGRLFEHVEDLNLTMASFKEIAVVELQYRYMPDDTFACYNVAECYYKGDGVEQSNEKANEWYLKAANKGNMQSQVILAANSGDAFSQFCPDWFCMNGCGVNQDKQLGLKWIHRATALSYQPAIDYYCKEHGYRIY